MSPSVPRILVTGADGQLGRSLRALARGHEDARYEFATRAQLDVTRPDAIDGWLDGHPADGLINAAAYTAVDRAVQEPERAMAVNGRAPGLLAQACARRGIRFFHVSTDYVFDGRLDRPYREDDATAPLNTYGRGKLRGEQAVRAACPDAVILRASWVFSAWAPNFVCTLLQRARQPVLRIVQDQVGGPTWAGHLAQALHTLAVRPARDTPGGLYHFAGQPWMSWSAFAREIFAAAQGRGLIRQAPAIEPIPSSQWPTPEPRPANSRLDCGKLEALLGPVPRDWRRGLDAVLDTMERRQRH
jgi:dTDP-4-dehydrorhamnose reductase